MNIGGRIQAVEFALVLVEVGVGEVANVDCASAVARKLMRTRAADTNLRICSWVTRKLNG